MNNGPKIALKGVMTDLEVKLTEVMVAIVVRYPDGWQRIQDVLESVELAGVELNEGKGLIDH